MNCWYCYKSWYISSGNSFVDGEFRKVTLPVLVLSSEPKRLPGAWVYRHATQQSNLGCQSLALNFIPLITESRLVTCVTLMTSQPDVKMKLSTVVIFISVSCIFLLSSKQKISNVRFFERRILLSKLMAWWFECSWFFFVAGKFMKWFPMQYDSLTSGRVSLRSDLQQPEDIWNTVKL